MKERNDKKAKLLYDFLDNSKMFRGTVVPEDRSLMNVPLLPTVTNSTQNLLKKQPKTVLLILKDIEQWAV